VGAQLTEVISSSVSCKVFVRDSLHVWMWLALSFSELSVPCWVHRVTFSVSLLILWFSCLMVWAAALCLSALEAVRELAVFQSSGANFVGRPFTAIVVSSLATASAEHVTS
jgi:hypothetical protein